MLLLNLTLDEVILQFQDENIYNQDLLEKKFKDFLFSHSLTEDKFLHGFRIRKDNEYLGIEVLSPLELLFLIVTRAAPISEKINPIEYSTLSFRENIEVWNTVLPLLNVILKLIKIIFNEDAKDLEQEDLLGIIFLLNLNEKL